MVFSELAGAAQIRAVCYSLTPEQQVKGSEDTEWRSEKKVSGLMAEYKSTMCD